MHLAQKEHGNLSCCWSEVDQVGLNMNALGRRCVRDVFFVSEWYNVPAILCITTTGTGPPDRRTRVTESTEHQTTKPQDHRTTEPQDHRTTGPQDCGTPDNTTGPHHRTTGPQNHRTTGPTNRRTRGPTGNKTTVPQNHMIIVPHDCRDHPRKTVSSRAGLQLHEERWLATCKPSPS